MSRLSAMEAESFLHTLLAFFSHKVSYFDDVYVHGIRVLGFGGIGEGLVRLMSRFGVLLGDFIGAFPLGLEGDGLFIPVVDGSRDGVHGYNATHEGGRDASREISDEDVLVGDAWEGGVGDILNEGRGIGVVFPLGHAFGGEPGDSIAGGVVVFERSLCLNAVSNFVTKLEKVSMVMVVPEMVFCLNVVAQVRADCLVM